MTKSSTKANVIGSRASAQAFATECKKSNPKPRDQPQINAYMRRAVGHPVFAVQAIMKMRLSPFSVPREEKLDRRKSKQRKVVDAEQLTRHEEVSTHANPAESSRHFPTPHHMALLSRSRGDKHAIVLTRGNRDEAQPAATQIWSSWPFVFAEQETCSRPFEHVRWLR